MGKRAEQTINLIVVGLVIFFWQLNFFLNSNTEDTIHFFLPSILLFCAFTLFKDRIVKRNILLATIPILNSSLILLPTISLLFKNKKLGYLIFGLIMTLVIFFGGKVFFGSSIFYFEHNDQQKIIRQGYLYPNIYLARLFQNKPTIYKDRFLFNFFSVIDPNNYFFGYHPRQITADNQNLQKFPFLSLSFFLIGLFHSVLKRKWFLVSLLIIFINLALLKNFDKTDSLVWMPISILVIEGIYNFVKKINFQKRLLLLIFFIFTLAEYFQLIVSSLIGK
jgi:hypothetical protein